jgi:hypothetical protein
MEIRYTLPTDYYFHCDVSILKLPLAKGKGLGKSSLVFGSTSSKARSFRKIQHHHAHSPQHTTVASDSLHYSQNNTVPKHIRISPSNSNPSLLFLLTILPLLTTLL